MKRRRKDLRAALVAGMAVVASGVVAACAPPPPAMHTAFTGATAGPLVLPSSDDQVRAEQMDQMLLAFSGRLDHTVGAPAPSLVDRDTTVISVIDQQFTWNGRVHDSYNSTRRTVRRLGN